MWKEKLKITGQSHQWTHFMQKNWKINFKARLQSFNICVRFSIRLQKAAAPTKNSFSICMHAWIHSPHNNNFFRDVKHKIFNHQCFIGTHHRTRQKLNCFYLHGLMQTTVLQCAAQKPPSEAPNSTFIESSGMKKVNNSIESF